MIARRGEEGDIQAIALAPDGQSFWVARSPIDGLVGTLMRISLDNGAVTERRPLHVEWITSIVPGAGHYDIPALAPAALALLAATLALAALSVLRR